MYCGTACRQAAHRARKSTSASLEATPPCANDIIKELTLDILEGTRDLLRVLNSQDAEEPLRRVMQLRTQLEGLTAGLVGQARHRRVTWRQIGTLLSISEDSARHRFTNAYIARRLGQMTRSQSFAPGSLDALYTQHQSTSADEDTDADLEDGPPPGSSQAAYNRLAPVLSMLARASNLPLVTISERIGCSASYVSRMLSGERLPSWRLTERFARVCGADPTVLRAVWESERLRDKAPRGVPKPPTPTRPLEHEPGRAKERLLGALRTLHVRAGQPSAYDIAVTSRWRLKPERISSILEGTAWPTWADLTSLLEVLGGSQDYFQPLWEAAAEEAKPCPPRDPAPPPTSTNTDALSGLMAQFGQVLASDARLTPAPNRVRRTLARQRPRTTPPLTP
jgi:transcriptional regulator with XRE-family HTH domain